MFKLIFSILFVLWSSGSYAHQCKLPKDQSITIGCTTKCKYFYKRALYKTAKKLGYRIKVVDMYNKENDVNLDYVDGVLIPGGADINPKYYTQHVEEDLKNEIERLDYLVNYSNEGKRRDPFEYKLLLDYFKLPKSNKLPLLGICRGMQLMAVSQKIPLYVDIKTEIGIRNRRYIFDKIRLTNESSKLSEILKFYKFWGFKQHHQGIRVPYFKKHKSRWPNLKITSYSNGSRIAESLEVTDREAFGVQFHPEIDFGKERHRIFGWLLEKACVRKKQKTL
tara:strand:+ start:6473 stop:7309 length:837 start_codon:yes stop_codon:yes gene_type:complete